MPEDELELKISKLRDIRTKEGWTQDEANEHSYLISMKKKFERKKKQ